MIPISNLLSRLLEIPSVSSAEDRLASALMEEFSSSFDRAEKDELGNLFFYKKGESKEKLMIAAHMDEIGLMIKYVDERGFLRAVPLGGIDPRMLVSKHVIVEGRKGFVKGVIQARLDEEKRDKPPEELFIDIGASSREDALSLGIEPGCIAFFERRLERLGRNRIASPGLDNKLGVYCSLRALLNIDRPPLDVYLVLTVQEELGLKGARVSSFRIAPDYGLVVDTITAGDFPGAEGKQFVELGRGPALRLADPSTIASRELVEKVERIAEKNGIKIQRVVSEGGVTDMFEVQLAREGIPTCALGIPIRYSHSLLEIADLRDIENCSRLIEALITGWFED